MQRPEEPTNQSERDTLVHNAFRKPSIHMLKRAVLNRGTAMPDLISVFLSQFGNDNTIIDIGCGTGRNASLATGSGNYYGIDINADHIAYANEHFGDSGTFIHGDANHLSSLLSDAGVDISRPIIVLMVGILHHLDDEAITPLFHSFKDIQSSRIALLAIDPVRTSKQNPIARFLVNQDRGQFVRTPEAYQALLSLLGSDVKSEIRDNLLRLPYNHHVGSVQFSKELAK